MKKFDIFLIIWPFVIIGFIFFGMMNNTKYTVVSFGDAHLQVPNRVAENTTRVDGEGYVFLHSDDYLVLGVEPDCESIDPAILEQFDVSFEKIKEINSIKYAYELISLVGDEDGVVVDFGKADKPSYEQCFLQYRSGDMEEIIYTFTAENKSAIEIIVAPRGDISKKEVNDMYGSVRFSHY